MKYPTSLTAEQPNTQIIRTALMVIANSAEKTRTKKIWRKVRQIEREIRKWEEVEA